MPHYYFRVEPDGPIDAEGEDLPDDAAAMRMAACVAHEIARNDSRWSLRRVAVYNEAGRLIDECNIQEAAPSLTLPTVK